jgi:ATP-dependent DNA helicase RecG
MQELFNSIEYLKGVGPKRAELLRKELGIHTFGDLLHYFPFRYVDKTKFYKTNEINSDLPYVQLVGKINQLQEVGSKHSKRLTARFHDENGTIELVWFKGVRWIKDSIKANTKYVVFGKPNLYNGKINIVHPDIEAINDKSSEKLNGLQPIYSTTETLSNKGLTNKAIGKLTSVLLPLVIINIKENLSSELINKLNLIPRKEAFNTIHFPSNTKILQQAQYRLKFEELFFIQLQLIRMKIVRQQKLKGFALTQIGQHFNDFFHHHLPFELTNAQKRVLKEIRHDCAKESQMNRLLQGDVGSGKTLVALMSILMAIDNGFQTCLMAPTEILAQQHFETISELVSKMPIKVSLLTGSIKKSQRHSIHEGLENGETHILIGTHALLEDKVKFKNLGFVVIDEQHRFGVAQRAKMWLKNTKPPHVLVMTATPIPRTLAMTLYGDLDVSVIDELPPGRKAIKTIWKAESGRLAMLGFIQKEIEKGRQAYIVYPLINESETLDYKDLMDGYESICRTFKGKQISIVHGQMKSEDKDFEMNRFAKGETQIMVATTVIEVGVNVPNASIMVIESAERFGLSQLHQLRGRVGRGAEQSYCVLMSGNKLSKEGQQRLKTMVRTTDGFEIAEEDLKLRGPGDLMGTQQSGMLELKIADLMKDNAILQYARQLALSVLDEDPELKLTKNKPILNHYKEVSNKRLEWSRIS